MTTTDNGAAAANAEEAAKLGQRLNELTEKANSGNRQALEELRQFLDAHPEIEQHMGDLAKLAESSWIELLMGRDVLSQESVKRQLAKLKENLAGTHSSTLEQLIVELVAINYLAERQAEIAAAAPGITSLNLAAFHLKRAESTQRRYLNSLKMLSHLRALLPQGLAPEGEELRLYDPKQKIA
jgi:hypothetical protein